MILYTPNGCNPQFLPHQILLLVYMKKMKFLKMAQNPQFLPHQILLLNYMKKMKLLKMAQRAIADSNPTIVCVPNCICYLIGKKQMLHSFFMLVA